MKWTELSVQTTNEAVDAVSVIFEDAGSNGVKIEDAEDYKNLRAGKFGEILDLEDIPHIESGALVTGYYASSSDIESLIFNIESQVKKLTDFGLDPGAGKVIQKPLEETEWQTEWEKYYHPVRVTRYLTVVPSWESYQKTLPEEKILKLDPGMAFGTGTHPTTKLCLQALEMYMRGGEKIIDVGTGSGVLSIAASKMGASKIQAYDLDQVAVDSAIENLKLNPDVKNVQIQPNDLLAGIQAQADIIVANILAEIIVPLVPQAKTCLKPGGLFITSGIIKDKLPTIISALKDEQFKVIEILKMKDWRAVVAQIPRDEK
ncbi:50S ribosomal protein L11 methyltransferase [Pediococcus damnosus]|uniref:50S ribosomal protein L11 methyltransferase n=1 Tax=Pediococcus damnosus TaxID=51663 RepID=UPI00061E031D|nr:50S ribosomal protein L11 methyltransferase [Pediococcus damnosus]AMV61603.1 Ribosomal protein L11 methyltransferase [Pediococcus damnosus]AMV65965.1 Ribosomal protein L11 methyltransferase [Pediococcus damnosus]KJU75036.1 ribosomal protein L11 methyltransferase [Pediococcus damnosus LMG 28219]KRN50316.1 ribosomal protein l11 methyltransferase (l11 mtas e) [Pediococcus damnosus]PIO81958.1 50S ribosomal protein L11 methyltransferase [Pediococcus damnosus]